jgi:hypothetical protein
MIIQETTFLLFKRPFVAKAGVELKQRATSLESTLGAK